MRRFLMRAGAMALIAVALMTWSVSRSDAAAPCQTCNDGGYAVNYGGSNVYNTGYAGYYGSYGNYSYSGYNGGYARPGIIRRVGGAAVGTVGGAISGFWQGLTDPCSLFANARCGRCPLAGGYCGSCGIVCQPVYTTSYGCTPCSAPCAPMPCEAPCAAPAPCAPMPCEAPCAAPAPCAPMPCEAPCAAPAPCAPMPCEAPAVCGPAPCMPPAMPCVPQIPAVAPVPPPCFAPAPCFAMTTCSPCEAPAPCAPMPCVAPCNGVYGGQSNYNTQPAVAPQRSSIAPAPAPAASNATLPPAAPAAPKANNIAPAAPAANVAPALPAQDDSVLPPPTTDYQPSQPGSILPPPTLDESMGGLPSASTQLRDASFSVVVPENAIVYVNNYQTKATGSTRSFVSSDLQPGKVYPYAVRVLVPTNADVRGKAVEVNGRNYTEIAKTVYVRAGEEVNLAFSATERDPLVQLASKK